MTDKRTPALGLIRVSTKRQAQQGYSPEEQRAAIARFADEQRLRIVEYIYEEKTGFTLDRQDVRKLRELAQRGTIRAVVAFVMDRLSRDLELQIALRKEIKRLNLELYTTTRGLIEDTPEANLLSNIEGAFSQHEIELLVRRSKMGRLGKAKSGKWVGVGRPPYGTRREGERGETQLMAVPEQLRVVKNIFDWYTGWNGKPPIGLAKIAGRLMERKVPAPHGGKVWWISTVAKIIHARDYLGFVEYGGVEIQVPALAVISREEWNAAQHQAVDNFTEAKRNRQRDYLMARRITCGCGYRMTAFTYPRSNRAGFVSLYQCNTKRTPKGTYEVCHFGTIAIQRVDVKMWEFMRAQLTPAQLKAGLLEGDAYQAGQTTPDLERMSTLDADIERSEQQIAALFDRFGGTSEHDRELMAQAELKIREVRQQIVMLRLEREELLSSHDRAQANAEARAAIVERVKKLSTKLDRATFAVKRQVIDLLDVQLKLGRREDGKRFGYVSCLLWDKPKEIDFD